MKIVVSVPNICPLCFSIIFVFRKLFLNNFETYFISKWIKSEIIPVQKCIIQHTKSENDKFTWKVMKSFWSDPQLRIASWRSDLSNFDTFYVSYNVFMLSQLLHTPHPLGTSLSSTIWLGCFPSWQICRFDSFLCGICFKIVRELFSKYKIW